jgi:mono/diheme cytochrome c family protein
MMRPALFLLAAVPLAAADFRRDIRPILEKHCYECHSEKAKKEKAGYVFDNLKRFAGDIDPRGIVVPGEPERSRFFEVVTTAGDNQMPPNGPRLDAKDIKLLRTWIEEGAALEKAATASGLPPKSQLPSRPAPAESPLLDWTSTDGKTIQARFVRLKEDAVVIRKSNGQFFKVPLDRLSPASKEQASKAAAAEPPP